MSDRDIVLSRIRAATRPVSSRDTPSAASWLTFDDPAARFAEVLESVGGRAVAVAPAALTTGVEQLVRDVGADRVWFDVAQGGIEPPAVVAELQLYVARGGIAVAENAAVWVVPQTIRHREALLLAEHVALAVERRTIVHNMHEAYASIDAATAGFGFFISGPSKTADIEQALVIGAHGPRSLTVFVVT